MSSTLAVESVKFQTLIADEDNSAFNLNPCCLSLRHYATAEPFQHKATITLWGTPLVTPELPLYGAKNIAVRRGTLDLHGKPVTPTWCQLAETAPAVRRCKPGPSLKATCFQLLNLRVHTVL